jgi:hypothetical protein
MGFPRLDGSASQYALSANVGDHLHYRDGIVVKDGWNIFRGKFVGGIGDQKARLANSTISNNDTPV